LTGSGVGAVIVRAGSGDRIAVCSTGIVAEGGASVTNGAAVGFAVPHPVRRFAVINTPASTIEKHFSLICMTIQCGRATL
jgi:hypothetical protein